LSFSGNPKLSKKLLKMQKFKYNSGSEIVEVSTLMEVPKGLEYETILFKISDTKDAEIEALREKTETEIDAFISPYVQKLILRQIEIPVEIMQEYNDMREAYGIEKQIILDK
jgi:hypothetical protein